MTSTSIVKAEKHLSPVVFQGRWQRISTLSPAEEVELHELTKATAGMTLYGNRARTSVMLPLELARIVANDAKERNCTVNQIIVELLMSANGLLSELKPEDGLEH